MLSRLRVGETVLVVVDMQERLLPAIHEHERVIGNARLMLRAAIALDLKVVMTTQYAKGLGPTHSEVAELSPPGLPIDKATFSCFGSELFTGALEATGRKTLLVCGVETHICVLQTVLDAIAANHQVHVVADATGSRTPENAALGLRRMEKAGAVVSSAEMAIYELLGSAGTKAFKSLLPHFK